MRKSILIGRLGKDARINKVGDKTVANFSIAADEGYGDKKTTEWIDCAYWRGEKVAQYLVKGTQVYVEGRQGLREYDGEIYLTCEVDRLELLGGKRDGSNENVSPKVDDDLPF